MIRILSAVTLGLALFLAPHALPQAHAENPIVVRGPTVVACFVPVTDADMEKYPNLNESLSDFQLYTAQARQPLQQRGIAFRVLSAHRFRMQVRGKVVNYLVGGVAYYFVAPDKRVHVHTGVMTDTELVEAADRYFGTGAH
ncbi:MAG TPA: hypothetical protein VJV22_14405 [Acidobacteriaceae bacterium]|nr:hypothetical protein [Acidobacteriaceae bacterium]